MFQAKIIETVVGAFVLLGICALLVLAFKVSNLGSLGLFEDRGYTIYAKFENIGGLKVRSPVKMSGVTVGRIASLDYDDTSYQAIAAMTIDNKYSKIPTDTGANVYTAGLLGEQYIALDPGGDEDFLKDGDKIKLTQSAVVLEQVIGQFLYSKAAGE